MNERTVSDIELSTLLIERGWVQGTVFQAPSACVLANRLPDVSSQDKSFAIDHRPITAEQSLVVVSQTCDIKAKVETEPIIEALLCAIEPDATRRANIAKSARWFEVDPTTGLVAHAMHRVQITKRSLLSLAPEPWPSTDARLSRFIRWLGHRYDRPAIPDQVVEHVQNPLEKCLNKLRKRDKITFQLFNDAVEDIRISLPDNEELPFEISATLLISGEPITEDQADAIETVMEKIQGELDPGCARLIQYYVRTPKQMSLAEFRATRPLYLETLTFRGDEILGAFPASRH